MPLASFRFCITSLQQSAVRRIAQILYNVHLRLSSGLQNETERILAMGRILNAIASGSFCTQTLTADQTMGNLQQDDNEVYTWLEQLEEKLGSGDRELLTKAVDSLFSRQISGEIHQFVLGFRLGALLMQEITESAEKFYGELGA